MAVWDYLYCWIWIIWIKMVASLLMWLFMTCDVNYGGGLRVHYRGSLGVRFILLILMILTSSSASSASHLILLVILILISILLSGVLYPPHTHHPPRPPSCTSQSRKKTDWFSPPAFVHPLHTSGVLLLSPWQHLAWAYLLNQRMNRIEQVFLSWQWLQNF